MNRAATAQRVLTLAAALVSAGGADTASNPPPPGASSTSGISVAGYLCPTCPSVDDPAGLLRAIHPAYDTVIIAFAGFDATGNTTNGFDTKTWALSAADGMDAFFACASR